MLRRKQGATIAQIVEATGWQPHTVRGAFAGALKKRLGLDDHLGEGGGPRAGLSPLTYLTALCAIGPSLRRKAHKRSSRSATLTS